MINTQVGIAAVATLALTIALPVRAQVVIAIIVLAAGASRLASKKESTRHPMRRFADAEALLRSMEPLAAFDVSIRPELESILADCVDSYVVALGARDSVSAAPHIATHLELRSRIEELLGRAAVTGTSSIAQQAIAKAEAAARTLFASYDAVLHAAGLAPSAPCWRVTECPSTCARIRGT